MGAPARSLAVLAAVALAVAAGPRLALGAAPAGAQAPGRDGPEPAVSLAAPEARALALVQGRLASRGATPRVSGALVLAARELARAAALGASEPLARDRVRAALAHAAAFDPSPAAALVEATPAQAPAAAAAALTATRATHVGAGAFERGGAVTLVILASERRATLAPFPREVAAGGAAVLAGALEEGLGRPRVFVTLPSGAVVEPALLGPARAHGGRDFRARIAFGASGRYTVEVVGEGAGGPEVAALLVVSAGGAPLTAPRTAPRAADPLEDGEAEAAVVRAVNATRRRQGLPAVEAAPELAAVARRHSAAMAAAGRVAHVLPASPDAARRLMGARIPFRAVCENVARAASALGAHDAAEESPAHLANLLRADVTRVGVGIARARRSSGEASVYLTEILVAPPDDGADSPLTPDARVREALWRERDRLGLVPLTADPALDDVARDAAAEMQRRDDPDAGAAGERALALRRRVAAVDVFLASGPGEAARSANLRDRRFRRVGVGVTIGDSRRYGAARYWIAVVYTD